MSIQQGSPAVFVFRFRRFDESGRDIGPMNLNNANYRPISVVLERPGRGEQILLEEDDLQIVDPANGIVHWEAAPAQIDTPKNWKAQGFAGDWPARIVQFPVNGPNLI